MAFTAWTLASLAAAEGKLAAMRTFEPPAYCCIAEARAQMPADLPGPLAYDAEYRALYWAAYDAEVDARLVQVRAELAAERAAKDAQIDAQLEMLRAADPVLMARFDAIYEVLESEDNDDDESDEKKGVPDRRRVEKQVRKLGRRLGIWA